MPAHMRLCFLPANLAWCFVWGSGQISPMDDRRLFHSRGDAVLAAERCGLGVRRTGEVFTPC